MSTGQDASMIENLGEFAVAPALERDLDEVVGLIEAADRSLGLPPDPVREELSWLWHLPTTRLDRDTRIVRDGETVVAYGQALWEDPDAGRPMDVLVRARPDLAPMRIGAWLMDWAEALVAERRTSGMRVWTVDRDEDLQDLLRSRGFVHVRSAFTMWKILGGENLIPSLPDGVGIRSYTDADERTLYEMHHAAFAENWEFHATSFERWNEFLHGEGWDPSLVFFAETDGVPAGYLVGFLEEACGFVGILGVLKPYRDRGVAKALLRRSFAEFARRGKTNVRLGVDAKNTTGAVALYESVGMSVHRRYDAFDRGTPEAAAIDSAT